MNNDLIKRGLAISYAVSGLIRKIDGEEWIRRSDVMESLNDVPPGEPTFTVKFDEEQLQEIVDKVKAEVLASSEKPQSKWGKWVITEIRCPICLEYFQPDCYSMEELNECPSCGADMQKGGEKE